MGDLMLAHIAVLEGDRPGGSQSQATVAAETDGGVQAADMTSDHEGEQRASLPAQEGSPDLFEDHGAASPRPTNRVATAQAMTPGRRSSTLVALPVLQNCQVQPPAVLLIHLVGNDLAKRPGKALILQVIADLCLLKHCFPDMMLIWSEIVPQMFWRDARHPGKVDCARRGVNREVYRAILNELGHVIKHPQLQYCKPELFRQDGVHLSPTGLDIFLADFQGDLSAML
ncbi:hypothetical protein JRQ81_017057, partial [Phrynocephalus forsythii]